MNADLRRRLESLVARVGARDGGPVACPRQSEPEVAESVLTARALDRGLPAEVRLDAARRIVERHRVDRGASALVVALLDDPDLGVLRGTIELVQPFDPAAMEQLVGLLDHPMGAVRYAAARALSRRKFRAAAPRLVAWLLGEDPEARRVAIDVIPGILGEQDGSRVLAALWERSDLSHEDRLRVAGQLAAAGDDRAADWLLECLDSGRVEAAEAQRWLEKLLERGEPPA